MAKKKSKKDLEIEVLKDAVNEYGDKFFKLKKRYDELFQQAEILEGENDELIAKINQLNDQREEIIQKLKNCLCVAEDSIFLTLIGIDMDGWLK